MLKKKIISIAIYLILAIVGILLFLFPMSSLIIAIRVIGIALLFSGVTAIVTYFMKEQRAGFDVFQCIGGGCFVVMAAVLLINPGFVISLFHIITGLIIFAYGILTAVQTITYKKLDMKGWQLSLALSVITICIGIIIFLNPYKSAKIALRLVGAVLIYSGISGIWFSATAKIVQIPDEEYPLSTDKR